MLQGWLTQIWFAFCGRWIRGKCRWRTEPVLWLWLTRLTTSGYRRPAKAHRTGCSRWNNHTRSNTQTPTEGSKQQRCCKLYRGSIPELPSHHVNSPSGELRSLRFCSSLISPCTTPLTYTGTPDQQLALEVIENHCLHVFPLRLFFKNQPPLFLPGCMSMNK